MAIVGTAYIRVKLISSKVSDDIKKTVEGSLKDAKKDIDKAAEAVGKDAGKSIAKGVSSSPDLKQTGDKIGKNVTKGISNGIKNSSQTVVKSISDVTEKVRRKVDKDGRISGNSFVAGFVSQVKSLASRVTSNISIGGALARERGVTAGKSLGAGIVSGLGSIGSNISQAMTTELLGGRGLISSFTSPPVLAAIAAAATLLGSFLVTGIAGYLSAVAGAGLVGGALILLISKDPTFKLAGQQAGQNLMAGLLSALEPIRGPLMGVLRSATDALLGILRRVNLKPLGNVANQISGAFQRAELVITRIFDALIKGSEMFLPILIEIVDVIGHDLAAVFEQMNNHSKEVKIAMGFLGAAVVVVARSILGLILIGIKLIELLDKWGEKVNKMNPIARAALAVATAGTSEMAASVNRMGGAIDGFDSKSLEDIGKGFDTVGKSAADSIKKGIDPVTLSLEGQEKAYRDVIQAQKDLISSTQSSLDPQLAINEAWLDITESIKENGRTLDIRTRAGQANYKTIEASIKTAASALLGEVQAGKISKAEADKRFKSFTTGALNAAGATGTARDSLNGLAREIGKFPDDPIKVQIQVGIEAAQVNIGKVLSGLRDVEGSIARINAERLIEKNKATGGLITGPGTATSDSIPTNLSNGEFVLRSAAVKALGVGALNFMNRTGQVPTPSSGPSQADSSNPTKVATATAGATTVNVYIGQEKLDAIIDTKIEENNETLAQQIVTGRR